MLNNVLSVGVVYSLAYIIFCGIAYGIAMKIAFSGRDPWRSVVGFLLAFVVGWFGGGLISAYMFSMFTSMTAKDVFPTLIGRGIWLALLGAGYGVYRARKKLKTVNAAIGNASHKATTAKPTTNDAFADALAEIEENRIDKGTWARCYAMSDGNESRAKAAYIKARAEASQNAVVWEDTKPPSQETQSLGMILPPSGTPPSPLWRLVGIAVLGIVAAIALPAYQDYSKRQAVATAPAQVPAPPETPGIFGENDKVVSTSPQLDLSEFQKAPNSQIESSAANKSLTYEDATGKQATQQAGRGPWEQTQASPETTQNATTGVNASESVQPMPPQRDSYVQKVRWLQAAVKRGEIPLIKGSVSFLQPKNPTQWSSSDAAVLEGTQTWWRYSRNDFEIHVKNTLANPIAMLGIDYSESDCSTNGGTRRFIVTPSMPIAAGSQSIIQFKLDFPVASAQPNNCLVIFSAWQ